jgi:hypothetical protein
MSEQLCTVPRCFNPRPGHQFVCMTCINLLKDDLALVPSMLAELDVTITRQDVMTRSGGGGRSSETALPFKWGASDALWVLGNVVTTWARLLVEHSGFRPPADSSQAGAAKFLRTYVQSLAMHPDVGEAVDEIESAVKNAQRAVDHPVDSRAYLGKCGDIAGERGCKGRVYALPREGSGTCDKCGELFDVRTRRALMLRSMANRELTSQDISTLLAGLGIELSVERIQKKIQDVGRVGRIKSRGKDVHGRRFYRVGDVLQELLGYDFLAA